MKLSTARKANLRSSRKRRRPGGPAFRNRNGRGGPGLSRRPGGFVPPAAESAPRERRARGRPGPAGCCRPGAKTGGRQRAKAAKAAERHIFEFCGFCLSHPLPGGKTRKVRKPPGFIRSDALVVRAGWNIRGCSPLSTPGFLDKLSGLSRIRPARLPGRTPQQILLINMYFCRQSAPRKIPRRAILSIDALGLRGAARPLRRKAFSAGTAALGKFSKSGTFHFLAGPPPFAVLRFFYGATVTYFLYIYPVSPVLLTRTWYQFPQSERMVSRVPFLSLPRLL